MSFKSTPFDEALQEFTIRNAVSESDVLARLREETTRHPMAEMQISSLQGAFMAVLVKALGAKRIIEVGTFTGYSSIAMAEAMGPDGRIVALDVSEEYTDVARRYWKEAGLADQIDLRIGPAAESLAAMIDAGESGSYDLVFVDADKEQYPVYFDRCFELVRPGGVILLDNMFRSGQIVDEDDTEAGVVAIRQLYAKLKSSTEIDYTVIPIADGLGIVHKR